MSDIPYCDNKSPRRLCESIGNSAPEGVPKLAKRPWNRFKPEITPWWLVPSAKQPFYNFGKLYFDWGEKERETILCGFYVEKGLDPGLSVVYPSKKGQKLMMRTPWSWASFMEELDSGRLLESFREISGAGLNIELHVDGGYVDEPGLYDPYDARMKNDTYALAWDSKEEKFVYQSAKRNSMVLKAMNKIKSYRDFQKIFSDFRDDQWLWLNVFIALRFKVKPSDDIFPEKAEVWISEKIWENFFSHFSHMIK